MTHDFTNKAIKCQTWQQMLHLAELAREQRYKGNWTSFCEDSFNRGHKYFVVHGNWFYNYDIVLSDETETTYTDFITPTTFITPPTDDSVYGC